MTAKTVSWRLVLLWLLSMTTSHATMYRRSLEEYPLALCNDGTHGVYFSSEGSGQGKDFVIWMEGGYYCHTVEVCHERCTNVSPHRCTTTDAPTMDRDGILSDDPSLNPDFHDWYKVGLHYCTSDLHAGNRTASEETGGYHFRGKDMMAAMVEDLKTYGLGTGGKVILTGTSGPGQDGTIFGCEDVRALLPGTEVWCLVDASLFYPDIPTFAEDCETMNEIIEQGNGLWNGGFDDFDVFSWWEDFELPLMIGIPMWDTYAMVTPYCGSSENPDHLSAWSRGMAELIEGVTEAHPEIALFIPGCVGHGMLHRTDYFTEVLVEGATSYTDVVAGWVNNGQYDQAWDKCDHDEPTNCNTMCP